MNNISVESFSISLPPVGMMPNWVSEIELAIMAHLSNCDRLVRWAIVQTSEHQWQVEGAYLSLPV